MKTLVTITSSIITQGAVIKQQDCLCSFWPWLLITKQNIYSSYQQIPPPLVDKPCYITWTFLLMTVWLAMTMLDKKKFSNECMSNILCSWIQLTPKHSLLYEAYGEDTIWPAHVFEWHKRKTGSCKKQMTWTFSNNENWWKYGKYEDPCENRWPFMHQNDCRRVEHGQINSDTNFNSRFQHKKKDA